MDTYEDVTELLDAITWGRRIVEVSNCFGELETFVLRPLSLEEKNMGNYIHKRFKQNSHLLTREQLKRQAIEQEQWKANYDNDLQTLRQELEAALKEKKLEEQTHMFDSKGRPKRSSPTTKLKRLNDKVGQIAGTLKQLEEAYTRHIELPSVEYAAECERGSYFLRCVTLTFPEMQQKWPTLEALQLEEDTTLVGNLMRAYYNDSIASEAAIRKIARSGSWRCKWLASKKNRGVKTLFNRDMYDLTLDQFRLVYWSQVYDSAFESMDAPSDTVIEDDKLFDKWLDEQHKKRDQERKKSEFDKKISKLNKGADANEVSLNVLGEYCKECTCGILEEAEARGVDKRGHIHAATCPYGVFLYYNKDVKSKKVEEVQSANPERVRQLLANEQRRLAKAGVDGVEEQYLRGDKTRQELGLATKTHAPGEYGKVIKGRAKPR